MQLARIQGAVLVSADTDFGELLARSRDSGPSVVLFRSDEVDPAAMAASLLANLDQIPEPLAVGAVVVILDDRIRARRLPSEADPELRVHPGGRDCLVTLGTKRPWARIPAPDQSSGQVRGPSRGTGSGLRRLCGTSARDPEDDLEGWPESVSVLPIVRDRALKARARSDQAISSRMSSALRLEPNSSPSSITPANSSALRFCRASTFSSMVSLAISR